MAPLQYEDISLLMITSFFFLGMCTFLLGIFVLVGKAMGRNVSELTTQTTALAQKGIAEDVAGLVGNASALMNSIQQIVRSTAGIGIFLTVIGLFMMGISYWILIKPPFPL